MNVIDITSELQTANSKIRLAAYCRVSSDSADQLHSFASQIRYYKDYERKNPRYQLVDIYADEGITGTSMVKRDEFNRMIRDCKKGKIDRIIVKSVSRFARNTQELLTAVRMLKEIGVSVCFEEQGIDTDKLNIEMILTFPGMAAQQESESISGNMRWSYHKRMESGEFNTCKPPYGYDMFDGSIVVNETEAQIVQEVFSLFLQGTGKQKIASILNSRGIPRKYGQQRWYHTTILYMLKNERYMGDALLQKRYTTDTLPFRQVLNKGERPKYYVENACPPIVSSDIFQAVQELLKKRECNLTYRRTTYPLSRKIRCPDCGRTYRRQIAKGSPYWICSAKASGKTTCTSMRIQEEIVYATFMTLSTKLAENRDYLFQDAIQQIELLQYLTSKNQARIKQIDQEIADLAARNLIIAKLHSGGILNASEFASHSSKLDNQISGLRSERQKLLTEDESDSQLNDLKVLNDLLEEYPPSDNFDDELMDEIVQCITVNPEGSLTFRLLGGVEFTETLSKRGWCITA